MKYPNLSEEKKLWKKGYKRIVSLDEAGRGALAGPVFVGAIILNKNIKNKNERFKFKSLLKIVKDSKKLSPQKRENIFKILISCSFLEYTVSMVSEGIIDKANIKNATELAMERCVAKFKRRPDFLIIDGKHISSKKLKKIEHKLIVKADEKVFSCAAASIIAKVKRDRFLKKIDKRYPEYGFCRHKGYGTKFHKKRIKKYGFCKIHRKTFRPIRDER
ncbi:MAG: ribonuclease HII [Candidatus Pacebacteria bacterium]|nr:ribonuclease HII [Candidatus Paceibacterota bacterium]